MGFTNTKRLGAMIGAALSSNIPGMSEGLEPAFKGSLGFDYKPTFGSYSKWREQFRDDNARMAAAERRRYRKPYDPRPAPNDPMAGHHVYIYNDGICKVGKKFRMRDGREYVYERVATRDHTTATRLRRLT